MTFSFEKKLILLFSSILIGIVVAGIVNFRDSESVNDTEHLVQHTREVLYESENVLSMAKDIVLSTRGYVITGDSVFLKPFHKASHDIYKSFVRLKKLERDDVNQKQRIDTLNKLIEKRIEISLLIIGSRKEKGFEHAQQLITSRSGKFYMDEIRNTVHAIQQEENKLLNEQQEANRESHAAFSRSFYFLMGSILLLLIIVFFTFRHNLQVRKKAEEETSKLKKELELIFNSVRDGIHGINNDGIIIFENLAAANMLGWEQNDLIGMPAHATIHHTYPNGVPYPAGECCIYATLKDGIVRKEENESFWRKDGTSFPVSYTSSPMRNEANEIIGTIVTFRDITEKKKAEEELLAYKNELEEKVNKRTLELSNAVKELKRNEEMLDETGRLAKVGGWEIDLANMNVVWTDEVYRIHELEKGKMPSVEEAINFYAPDAKPTIQAAMNKSIETGEAWDMEFPFITAKGKNIWLRVICKTEIKDGKTVRLFGVFQDVTERKKTEMEKIEYIASLEEMIFMTSHKVRQPIANILGLSTVLDMSLNETMEIKKIVDFMKLSALKLDEFTHELNSYIHKTKENI